MPIDVGESEMDKLKIEYFKTDELIPLKENLQRQKRAFRFDK